MLTIFVNVLAIHNRMMDSTKPAAAMRANKYAVFKLSCFAAKIGMERGNKKMQGRMSASSVFHILTLVGVIAHL